MKYVPDPKEITWVVAKDRPYFEGWRDGHGYDPNAVRYVREASVLKGRRNVPVLFLEHWMCREDWRKVHNAALAVMRRPLVDAVGRRL